MSIFKQFRKQLSLPAGIFGMWLLSMVFTTTGLGQGTSGMVPDPISTRDLDRGLTMLKLSPQQIQAVNALHDIYRLEYAELRADEIEEYVEDSNSLRRGMSWVTDRKAVEDSVRSYERLLGRIKRLDDRLFDEVEILLTQEQVPYLQRTRQARERQRYRSGMTRWMGSRNPAAQVDVSFVVLDLQLSAQDFAQIDQPLSQYERSLTGHVKKLNELSTKMPLETMKRLQAMGFTEETMQDPSQRGRLFEEMRGVWNELYADINKRTLEISDLNKRTCKDLTLVLPENSARQLRHEYHNRAYPDVPSGPSSAERGMVAAMQMDTLTDDQRAQILSLRDQLRRDLDQITDQAIEIVDEGRSQSGIWGSGSNGNSDNRRKLEDLETRRGTQQKQAVRTLEAILGEDLSERVRTRIAIKDENEDQGNGGGGGGGGPGGGGGQNGQPGLDVQELGPDPFLPGPITGRALRTYTRQLQLDEEMLPLIEAFYEDYMTKYQELSRTTLTPLRTARWRLRGGEEAPSTEQDVEELFKKRRDALRDIMELDEAFLTELALVLEDEQAARLDRVKLSRQRMIFNRGLESQSIGSVVFSRGNRSQGRRGRSWWFGDDASRESSVDVASVANDVELSKPDIDASDPILEEYELAALAAFRSAYNANFELQKAAWSLRIRGDSAERSGTSRWRRIQSDYRQMQETLGQNATDAQLSVVELNRATMAELTKVLSGSGMGDVERAYRKLAYDRIYQDPRAANEMLETTLAMDDLTTDQRMSVTEVASEYRNTYEDLCDQMVEISAEAIDADSRNWSERQERWQRLERLRFERDEASSKTRLRVRAVLNADQIQQLGPLADPPPEDLEG
jgi:hypothetical protein